MRAISESFKEARDENTETAKEPFRIGRHIAKRSENNEALSLLEKRWMRDQKDLEQNMDNRRLMFQIMQNQQILVNAMVRFLRRSIVHSYALDSIPKYSSTLRRKRKLKSMCCQRDGIKSR